MTKINNSYESINDYIDNLDECSKLNLHNQYCIEHNYNDDYIYTIDDYFIESNIKTIINSKNFYKEDKYCHFNGYGFLDSFNDIDDYFINRYNLIDSILTDSLIYNIELI